MKVWNKHEKDVINTAQYLNCYTNIKMDSMNHQFSIRNPNGGFVRIIKRAKYSLPWRI